MRQIDTLGRHIHFFIAVYGNSREKNFRFGCGKELKKEMQKNFDFEELRKENQTYLGEKMRRSGIRFRSDDQDLSLIHI